MKNPRVKYAMTFTFNKVKLREKHVLGILNKKKSKILYKDLITIRKAEETFFVTAYVHADWNYADLKFVSRINEYIVKCKTKENKTVYVKKIRK